uniref:Uncharacterized protein n=1 Tax=Anguilla anguilla TaxID=7936 RepID=A0A0E9SAN9_ANGAN
MVAQVRILCARMSTIGLKTLTQTDLPDCVRGPEIEVDGLVQIKMHLEYD